MNYNLKQEMRKLKLQIFASFLLVLILIILVAFGIQNRVNNVIFSEKSNLENNIGKKVIIDNDTLTIVNYSLIKGEYTLSNGTKIDKSYHKK